MLHLPRTQNQPVLILPLLFLLIFPLAPVAQSGNATWKSAPVSTDWNTASNWTPATVPNGPGDTASFATSSKTTVSVSQETEVAAINFDVGAKAFTISAVQDHTLAVSGAGIVNNSGKEQHFIVGSPETSDYLVFHNAATAGSLTTFTVNAGIQSGGRGGNLWFQDNSTAGEANFITMGGSTENKGYGYVQFFSNATAAQATFLNMGATAADAPGGATFIYESLAGEGSFTNEPGAVAGAGSGATLITVSASAENGIFTNNGATVTGAKGGTTTISQDSTAASAILIANGGMNGGGGGSIEFDGTSTGDLAQVRLFGNGFLDVYYALSLGIGSLEGDGLVLLASTSLSVGANNLDKIFSGSITGGDGILEKVGSGTLTLAGEEIFFWGTAKVTSGVLEVSHDHALPSGRVIVGPTGTLRLKDGATNDYLDDGSTLELTDGATVDLDFTGVSDKVLSLTIDGVAQEAGEYGSVASGAPHPLPQFSGLGTILVGLVTRPRLLNISTRLAVQTGDNVLIGGFIITGFGEKNVLIRGIGPSLENFGVPGALQNPKLQLVDGFGEIIATNDDWRDSQEAEIAATGIPPSDDREAAILAHLSPGSYTAILQGENSSTGVGLVEVYDLDGATADLSLANISTRGLVQGGDNVMIGGLIVGPDDAGAASVIIRAIGPSLSGSGIADPLPDPVLSVYDGEGNALTANDNWRDSQENLIATVALAPEDELESALLLFLGPGNYTAIVSGKDEGSGVALVEAYHLE